MDLPAIYFADDFQVTEAGIIPDLQLVLLTEIPGVDGLYWP